MVSAPHEAARHRAGLEAWRSENDRAFKSNATGINNAGRAVQSPLAPRSHRRQPQRMAASSFANKRRVASPTSTTSPRRRRRRQQTATLGVASPSIPVLPATSRRATNRFHGIAAESAREMASQWDEMLGRGAPPPSLKHANGDEDDAVRGVAPGDAAYANLGAAVHAARQTAGMRALIERHKERARDDAAEQRAAEQRRALLDAITARYMARIDAHVFGAAPSTTGVAVVGAPPLLLPPRSRSASTATSAKNEDESLMFNDATGVAAESVQQHFHSPAHVRCVVLPTTQATQGQKRNGTDSNRLARRTTTTVGVVSHRYAQLERLRRERERLLSDALLEELSMERLDVSSDDIIRSGEIESM
jgi:hypothetical protein